MCQFHGWLIILKQLQLILMFPVLCLFIYVSWKTHRGISFHRQIMQLPSSFLFSFRLVAWCNLLPGVFIFRLCITCWLAHRAWQPFGVSLLAINAALSAARLVSEITLFLSLFSPCFRPHRGRLSPAKTHPTYRTPAASFLFWQKYKFLICIGASWRLCSGSLSVALR